ncbi:MAG: HEAT repeat domain-containing protein [Candidatus Sulfotelmatobacter sp.]
MLEKIGAFFKQIFDSYHVVDAFPEWFKALCVLSTLYFLLFGGMFIFYYSKFAALLKTSAVLSALEKKALLGDAQAMLELSFSESSRSFEILSSVLRTNPQDEVRQQAVFALANLKDRRKVAVLGDTLVAEKWEVAGSCAEALGRSGDPGAVPYLLKALELHIDWVVAQKSAAALGNFEPNATVARALVRAMNEGDSSFEAEAAKQSLVKFGGFSLSYLIEGLRSSTSSRGLSEGIHAIRLIGAADTAASIASLENTRTRIPTLTSLDEKARSQLIADCDRAIEDLQQQGQGVRSK